MSDTEEREPARSDTRRTRIKTKELSIRHVRREDWLRRLVLLVSWVGGVALIATGLLGDTVSCITPIVMLLVTATLIGRSQGAAIAGVRARGVPGVLVVDDEGVEVTIGRRRRRFARSEIALGWVERFGTGHDDVVLQMRSGVLLRATTGSVERGRAVLRAAGVAPHQRAIALRLGVAEDSGTRIMLVVFAIVLALLTIGPIGVAIGYAISALLGGPLVGEALLLGVVGTLAGLAGLSIVGRPLITTSIRIGTDGIVVERLFQRRFVARSAFREVSVIGNELEIAVTEGRGATATASTGTEASTVATRIREAMAEGGDAAAATLERLSRGERSIDVWLRDVRALARESSGYRHATLHQDELLAVVEDGAAGPDQRIAAALAVTGSESEGQPNEAARKRVRIAAESCADERLRLALEEAAEGEIEAATLKRMLEEP